MIRQLIKRFMTSARVTVDLPAGTLSGVKEILPNGKGNLYAFKGIPYAKPPIGELRFKAPVPVEKYSDSILDCSTERDVCYHQDPFTAQFKGSEDCLYLNVFTPKLSKSKNLLPVIIYVHGGAFRMGSGNSDYYSPEYLVQEDVIVVTINYRLHILGFLYLPDAGIMGNFGLKDQLLALKWVNANISKFNGDPNNVTFYGESAGASCVHLHVLNPESRKYIHKAILQSGAAVMDWSMQREPEEKSRILAKNCGCNATTDKEIGNFLKSAPIEVMMKNMLSTLSADEQRRSLPIVIKPVIEAPGPESVVTRNPFDALENTSIGDIPILTGVCDGEGINMTKKRDLKLYEKDLTRFIPMTLNLVPSTEASEKFGQEIRKFYFGNQPITENSYQQIVSILSDVQFIMEQHMSSELHARYQHKSNQYFYQFAFEGELNMYKKKFNKLPVKGAAHADDLAYIFNMKTFGYKVDEETKEFKIRRIMCRMWANFARYGNPTPDDDKTLPVRWIPVEKISPHSDEFDINCLYIGNDEIKMITNPDKERIDFWRNAYKKWNGGFLRSKL